MDKSCPNRGAYVTAAGVGINLALGVLYAWSIFKAAIKQSIEKGGRDAFHWDMSSLNDPYAVCCLVFACAMIVAGRCQDRFGARITASIGGLLVGAGFLLASGSTDYSRWVAGFGVLAGAGIAFGYSAATPAALKWYPPAQTGKIAGIVVSGFGLASVYIAPLTQYLLDHRGMAYAMRFYGIAFPIVVCVLAWLLVPPPAGYVPGPGEDRRFGNRAAAAGAIKDTAAGPSGMIRTKMFWIL